MAETASEFINEMAQTLPVRHNRFTLSINNLSSAISVSSIEGQAELNQPWQYELFFTSDDKSITAERVLKQSGSLTFNPAGIDLAAPTESLTQYGVITHFSLCSVSAQQALYRVTLRPRLYLLDYHYNHAIYQQQSVVDVVESVLRHNGFSGVDFRFELKDTYPVRELITQWDESDLAFVCRLLADVGIWFRFDSHGDHHCDVLVMSDYEQGYQALGNMPYQPPSGMTDSGVESIWDISLYSKIVTQQVQVNDYNPLQPINSMQTAMNSDIRNITTYGTDYRYGEQYLERDDQHTVESGAWYAKIRHQADISQHITIQGTSNHYQLMPGQHVQLDSDDLPEMNNGFIIVSTQCTGSRSSAYRVTFTAIPFDALKPYRPKPLKWPTMSGTIPARITSPDNDTYGYIDTQGRYRVKFDFDLNTWPKGEESLWLRLAKPYAGDDYGFHFPLIEGTEVAIGFMQGNLDRPYIAHAMHDSAHPDLVTTENNHRNVIRTPANNKLRMDDTRDKEHIKLATEHGKTQLNLGHLVDHSRAERGKGFELRTDEWGAIAANNGLYFTTQAEPKAQGKLLDMQATITHLDNALTLAQSLKKTLEKAEGHPADTDSQQQLLSALTDLNQSGLIMYGEKGIALTSSDNIQLSSGDTVTLTADNQVDILSLSNIVISTRDAISLFAQQQGIKMVASKGDVEIQAQNETMELSARQNITINSTDGDIDFASAKEIRLMCGGSYLKINGAGIELGTKGNVTIKSNAIKKMTAKNMMVEQIKLKSGDFSYTDCGEKKRDE